MATGSVSLHARHGCQMLHQMPGCPQWNSKFTMRKVLAQP